ncbi:MAG: NAD(P)/FAD-dependent oxidoreductase [Nitrospira sp.]|jgi:protoporphyrinogen oxidase|nr:NAD(P)/FAD-dependent oxidoreductase [Nitrospira sp.]
MSKTDENVVIIGGGPAGLTAAYQLCKAGRKSVVLEKDSILGGISRTVNHRGYHFDIGGHRFFTKVGAVDKLWREILPDEEFLHRPRLSRIYYNRKFFFYPLKPLNAFLGLGVWNSISIGCSYVWAQIFPQLPEDNFEQWVSNRFGQRLYRTFFKTYTEKVWGMPAHTIAAEWAAQRIKGLSLLVAVKNALLKQNGAGESVVKTLIDSFHYPKRGPGMMWEAVADKVKKEGSEVLLESEARKISWQGNQVVSVDVDVRGRREVLRGAHYISSMPIRELIQRFDPPVPEPIRDAADRLRYRDFLTVALIVNQEQLFPDNWIYIHDEQVKVGRIQNFKNWSPDMVPDPSKTCLGLEYFCFEGDGLWSMSDKDLIELAKREVERIGIAKAADVEDGAVVRMPKAYPVYDAHYRDALTTLRGFLDQFANFQVVGRNGMHRYNNQDHSMLTAMLAVENIMGARHDLWQVNGEQEYHEETTSRVDEGKAQLKAVETTQPLVPQPVAVSGTERLVLAFAKMDKLAFATALGTVSGLTLTLATLWLVIKGGEHVGQTLQLLDQFFPGYTVTGLGALVGFGYGFATGFLWGWLYAYLRNFSLGLVIYRARREAEMMSFQKFLDHY